MLRIKTQISPGMLSKIASRRGFNTRQASYSRFQNHRLGFVMFCGLCSFVFCSNAQEHSEWLRGAARGQRWGFLTRGQRRLRPAGPLPAATPAPIHWAGGFVPITRVSFEAIAFSGGCLKCNVIRRSLTLCWFARACPADGFLNPRVPCASVSSSSNSGRMAAPPQSRLGNSGTRYLCTCSQQPPARKNARRRWQSDVIRKSMARFVLTSSALFWVPWMSHQL